MFNDRVNDSFKLRWQSLDTFYHSTQKDCIASAVNFLQRLDHVLLKQRCTIVYLIAHKRVVKKDW